MQPLPLNKVFFLMKNMTLALLSLTMPLLIAEETVNLYSQRHYDADKKVFAKFTEQTGIKVKVVKGKADELIQRLKSEGKKTPADILLTKDAARIVWADTEGLLQSVSSETLNKQVPKHLRDPEGKWYGITQRARVLIYAKDRVKPESLTSYDDLTKPAWKGKVVARSSANIYNQSLLSSIIANKGEKAALVWAIKVRQNMARKPQGSDRDQIRAVAAGVADVAIANTYYLGLLANSENPKDREVASKVAIAFPEQKGKGTHVNISGAGIVKHAKNKKNAVKFLEFLTGEYAQSVYPEGTYEYPLNLKSEAKLHKEWGTFKPDTLNLKALGKNNAKAVKLFQTAKWE